MRARLLPQLLAGAVDVAGRHALVAGLLQPQQLPLNALLLLLLRAPRMTVMLWMRTLNPAP
jgi:hypothetical protein